MAYLVRFTTEPRYVPEIVFPGQSGRFLHQKYWDPRVPHRYDPAEVPRQAFLTSGNKTIPDFVPIHARWGVSPEARALIEEFEPGVHQFVPVEILRPRSGKPIHRLDGRVLDTPYYLFSVQTLIDAVWVERSEVEISPVLGSPPSVYQVPGRWNIVLRRDLVAGHHVWRGRHHLPRDLFFSDALAREVEARRLRKLQMHRLEEA